MKKKHGFTLVELLVVIGIIALLISILLPALSSARRQANTVKCESSLRQLGNAMLMYVQDNKGYLPAPRITYTYNVGSLSFIGEGGNDVQGKTVADYARWFNLIAKYVMHAQSEGTAQNADQMNQQLTGSVIWGCPSFQGFVVSSQANSLKGDVNRNYPPYSMNCWPTFTATYPDPQGTVSFPTPNNTWRFEATGKWYKLINYTQPSERALLGDARGLLLEARAPTSADSIPGQPLQQNQSAYVGSARGSTLDFYRHGKYPPVAVADPENGYYSPNGGKVGFNILFADMHVATQTDRGAGYKALRMRFPL